MAPSSSPAAAPSLTIPSFAIQLLGGFEVRRDGQVQRDWTRAGPRHLLKRLALAPQFTLGVPALAEAFWPGEADEPVRKRLHHLVYLLRRGLGMPRAGHAGQTPVMLGDGRVALRAEWFSVDVALFEARLGAALRLPSVAAIDAALALYGGPLLPGEIDDEALNQRRVALERLYVAGLFRCAELERADGALAAAAVRLQQVLAREPAHEAAHRLLIDIHGARGDRAQAEQQFLQCRAALSAELGVLPEAATHQAYRVAMRGSGAAQGTEAPAAEPAASAGRAAPESRYAPPLPDVRLVGRDDLLLDLATRLTGDRLRLLTLTGPGGIGKTQLALHLAQACVNSFGDGVCVVPLAETDAAGVLERLCRSLQVAVPPGRAPVDALVEALRPRRLLLVVDNCEHVLDALGVLSVLLQACPRLAVLATSRRRLNLQHEVVQEVPGLALTPEAAIALFIERAQAVDQRLQPDPAQLPVVAQIVELLEGNPLAIELVAARVHVLGLAALRESLAGSFALVAGGGPDRPPRHRSLEDSLRWSLQQLSTTERAVLDRTALFAAPFTLPALAALCADLTDDLVSVVQSLLELHLLSRAADDRLRVLAGTQALLRAAAPAAPPAQAVAALLSWQVTLTDQLDAALAGPAATEAVARLDAEIENLYALLALAEQQGDAPTLCRLVRALCRYWVRVQSWERPQPWLALARTRGETLAPRERARLGHALAVHAFEGQRYAAARDAVGWAMQAAAELDDARLQARIGLLYGACCYHVGQSQAALPPLRQARSAAQALGDDDLLRTALTNLGSCQLAQGDVRAALRSWTACDRSFEADLPARVAVLHNLALAAHYRGRREEARGFSDRAVAVEQATLARAPRLAVLWLRRCWMLACANDATGASEALARARAAALAAGLSSFDLACAAHAGKVALCAGRSEQAVALLARALGTPGSAGADPWDEFDARLWLVSAHLAQGQTADAEPVLQALCEAAPAFLHEQARLLEAGAAWLLASDRVETAARAWSVAAALRAQQGIVRFAVDQGRARRTQARLRQVLGPAWSATARSADVRDDRDGAGAGFDLAALLAS